MGLNLLVSSHIVGDYTGTSSEAAQDAHIDRLKAINFLTGSAINQANLAYSNDLALAASGSTTLNLSSLSDALNNALSFAAIKLIALFNDPTSTGNLIIGNAASTSFEGPLDDATATIAVPPGGWAILTNPTAAGWAVSTNVSLKIAASGGGPATGELFLLGI